MKTLYYILIPLLFLGAKGKRMSSMETENKNLKSKLEKCHYAYRENIKILDTVTSKLYKLENHVLRMQYITGIKNPDSVFTWKEKVINPIKTRRTIKFDRR